MSKLSQKSNRRNLPDGFRWAEWSKRNKTIEDWESLPTTALQAFRTRFKMVMSCQLAGKFLPHERFYVAHGIGYAKVFTPNPGWRAYAFRDGAEWFVTHFSNKADAHHEMDFARAAIAKTEHLEWKKRTKKEMR